MKTRKCLLLAFTVFFLAVQPIKAQQGRKVVFVIADGISADALEGQPVPHLKRMIEKGSYYRAYQGGEQGEYSESPTISAVGYNNVLTGVWYNKHNVPDNDIKAPNYHYPTIFRLFKDRFPKGKIGIFSSWEDNRTKLIGEGLPETGSIKMDYAFDGLELDTVSYPHDRERQFMSRIDEAVVARAAQAIEKDAPDLSWVYLEYTDDMGHMYGDSPQYADAIARMDEQIGKLLAAIHKREKEHGEEWLLLVMTDHGRDEKTGKHHGGQSYRQRSGWIASNKVLENAYSLQLYPAAVDILPTIARFLNVNILQETQRELDGIALTGPVSLVSPQVHHFQDKLDITWIPLEQEGEVKIYLSTTNNVKEGGKDEYRLLGTFPLKDKRALVSVKEWPSSFYKLVLEGAHNTMNRWVMVK